MRYLSFAIVVMAAATGLSAQSPAPAAHQDKVAPQMMTLTGCVSAGEKPDTYLLTHVAASADPVGTSGRNAPEPFYWLDSPDKLKAHVGHKVVVTGMLDDDLDKTKIERKDGEVKVETERTKEVKTPAGSSAAAALPESGKQVSYKVKVKTVTMLASSCGH